MSESPHLVTADTTPLATVADVAEDVCLVATTAQEMRAAQTSLAEWFRQKVSICERDQAELEANLQTAIASGWKTGAAKRQVNLNRKRIEFYQKCLTAVENGYAIVPNFPVDVFAIRTRRSQPEEHRSRFSHDTRAQHSEAPTIGEGRYVSDRPEVWKENVEEQDAKTGEFRTVTEYFAKDFEEVEFPISIAKAQVMSETARAMATKVFDEIGVLPNRRTKGDPIVVGRVRKPRGESWRDSDYVTFLIVWWIDTRAL